MDEYAWKALAAMLAAIGAALELYRRFLGPKASGPDFSAAPIRRVVQALMGVISSSAAHRAALIRVENGGGVPSASGTVYATAIWEACEPPLPPITSGWQRVPADSGYQDVLRTVLASREAAVGLDDLPDGSRLRDLFSAQGVTNALVLEVFRCDSAFYYLSLHFTETYAGPADRLAARAASETIAATLRSHRKIVDAL